MGRTGKIDEKVQLSINYVLRYLYHRRSPGTHRRLVGPSTVRHCDTGLPNNRTVFILMLCYIRAFETYRAVIALENNFQIVRW